MQYGESSLPKGQLRTPPLNSAAASRRVCPDDPPRRWIREVRFLRCRDHAVHGVQVGSLAAPLTVLVPPKRIRVDHFCSRNHKNCCLADEPLKKQKSSRNVRRALLRLSPCRVGKNPDKKKRTQAGSRSFSRKSCLCPFDFLALFSFPQNCGRWGDWQFSSLPKQLILQKRLEGLFKEQGRT